jgi:amidase
MTRSIVTEQNPDALAIAAQLDAQRKAGQILGPLHGVPIVVKNNIATNDLMNNTAGSYALLGAKVPEDSTVIAKLRKAGAIILGKSNLSQWAYFRCYNCSNGWSAYGGQTHGAYFEDQDPSGSSSGSGVSTSIGAIWAALGTETDGSIIGPADVNNVVGIKPTVGLTSRYLVIPISEHQDTVGSIARTVKDAAYLLSAIAGFDAHDNYTTANPSGNKTINYALACNGTSLKGKRFGVPLSALNQLAPNASDPLVAPVLKAFASAVATIKAAGATIVNTNMTVNDGVNEEIVLDADFPVNLKTYLDALTYNPQNIQNVVDLRDFTERDPREDWSPTSRDVAVFNESIDLGYNNTDPRFWDAYSADLQLGGPDGVLGALARDKLDAVLLPSQFSYSFAAIVGTPVVSVPMVSYCIHASQATTNHIPGLLPPRDSRDTQ